MHCLPLIILFAMHLSYPINLKPQFIRVSKSSPKNRRLPVMSCIILSLVSHISSACHTCFPICISCIDLDLASQSAGQQCPLTAYVHLPPYPHVGRLPVCLLLPHVCLLLLLLHMKSSWLQVTRWASQSLPLFVPTWFNITCICDL